jgi:hypothetical protein
LRKARFVVGRLGQRRHQHLAGQLAHLALEVAHRLKRQVGTLGGDEIDLALGKLEGERLRPDAVFAGGQRGEVIVALLVGIDAGGDRRAVSLGRDRHARKLLPLGRNDRPAEQVIGGVSRGGETSGDEYAQQQPMGLHGVAPCLSAQRVAVAGTAFRYAMMASISARCR